MNILGSSKWREYNHTSKGSFSLLPRVILRFPRTSLINTAKKQSGTAAKVHIALTQCIFVNQMTSRRTPLDSFLRKIVLCFWPYFWTKNAFLYFHGTLKQVFSHETKCIVTFLLLLHSVWKSPKMSHLSFSITAFSTDFCPNVNVARFARNVVKWDFFYDFQTQCYVRNYNGCRPNRFCIWQQQVFFDRIQFGYTLDVCMCSVFGQLHARAISGNFLQI